MSRSPSEMVAQQQRLLDEVRSLHDLVARVVVEDLAKVRKELNRIRPRVDEIERRLSK